MKLTALATLATILFPVIAAGAATETDVYRLPHGVAPIAQQVELTVDPGRPDFEGRTTISLRVDSAVDRIGLHQNGLDMHRIVLASDGLLRPLTATRADYDINWLSDGRPVEAGDYTLHIEYSGDFATDSLGMHRVNFQDNDYVFTQFQAMHAREAIPTFDEPCFKHRFRLTINAPEDHAVVANTPVAKRTVENGIQRVEFRETPPMPSYLLAYAVGPLDRAPIDGLSVPGFVYTPAGLAGETGFARRATSGILDWFEDYFGRAYPYEKLDFIAVPDFAFGGMENPGLVTYRSEYLLVGDEASGAAALWILNVIGHEIAHMWFGNLVTLTWWDDMWLNEAFPSWLSARMLEDLYPEYGSALKLPQTNAFQADRRQSAKPIRKTVRTEAELIEDLGLNYTKGSALLRMLETYVGPETWREGVQTYVNRHAWGNTVETDLWAAVAQAADQDIAAIADAYLNQPGFALLEFDADGGVTQRRFGGRQSGTDTTTWQVPLTVRYSRGGRTFETRHLLSKAESQLDVPDDVDWLFPDVEGQGYFRWRIDAEQFAALLGDIDLLSDREKVAMLDNSDALLSAELLPFDSYLAVLSALLDDPEPLVALPAIEKLKNIGDDMVDATSRAQFARLVDARLAARFAAIGTATRPGDSEALIQLRPRLLRILGQYGSDPAARDIAMELATRYLEAPDSMDTGLGREALRMASLIDDGGRFEDYIDAYERSTSVEFKAVLLQSTYFSGDEQLHAFYDFLLTPEVAAGDVIMGLVYLPEVLGDHAAMYAWLEENFEALTDKLPDNYEVSLPQYLAGTCTPVNRDRLAAFFEDRAELFAPSLAKALEEQDACMARKARYRDALLAYLDSASGD